ncbi:MAG: DUF4859 domain-containing protein [Bacteroidales bacterium]|nr:DUF4859 domain-containing protein [Bacteroidales bacterium]
MKIVNNLLLGAAVCAALFSCTKNGHEPEPEDTWTENTGEITYKIAPSATFTAEGGEKTVRFYCTESWHIECSAGWLHFDPERGEGTGEKKSFKVTITADENSDAASRKADVSIVSGESKYTFTVTQKAPVITLTDAEIAAKGIDVSRIYTGITGSLSKLKSSDNEFFLGRARTSEHFIVLWDKGYDETGEIDPGDTETPQEIRVDVDDLLKKAEIYYDTYVNKFGMRGPEGESFLDKYYMSIFLYGTTNWKAEGGGTGDMGGLWVSATACQPTGSTVAHEIAHAFQYQVYSDFGQKDAGFMQSGGVFWEACANWQSFNLYGEQAYTQDNFRVFAENSHRHFHYFDMRYASYWFQFLWTDKYGFDAYGRIWKESKRTEDACQAYMRLYCGGDLTTFNRDLYEYAARCATWDFATEVVNLDEQGNVQRTASIGDFGTDYIGNIGWVGSDDGDGWNKVGDARTPEATGFNIIRLKPAAGETVTAEFEGLSTKADAGWTYGFVALLADGSRAYSEPSLTGSTASATWTVPANTEKLWLVVSCTPSRYYGSEQGGTWPYRVRFTGTDLITKIAFTGDETPHDTEIVKDIDVPAADGYAGPSFSLDSDDFEKIGYAFVMQPSEIAAAIASDRANYASGKVKFGSLEPDGSISYNYTANGYGFWYAPDGSVTPWGGTPTVYTQYDRTSWTFQVGTKPGVVSPGENYTIRPVFVYGDYKAVVTIHIHVK